MATYYNEIDPFATAWLRNVIAAGLIPDGEVDERSILDVEPGDLRPFRQCHFFAGIGGWPHALELAGWPSDRPVWTGSCPCQPLSSAGQRKGHADERHLWPAFYRLVAECRPATVFGEQVASKDGREWLAGVRADLEHLGYAVGAADLCAAGVGAPHIRQRLYWVGNTEQPGLERHPGHGPNRQEPRWFDAVASGSVAQTGAAGGLGDAPSDRCSRLGKPEHAAEQGTPRVQLDGPSAGRFWDGTVWLPCLDGKARRIEPAIQPLADGIRNRVGLLRGSGNAIVPQVASQFVAAVMEVA